MLPLRWASQPDVFAVMDIGHGERLPGVCEVSIQAAMIFETCWLVVPLIGTGCRAVLWPWLRLTRQHKPKAGE
jgi:hypothetical protein